MSGFRRIDTLIPYKEPDFRPKKKRLGALAADKSVWATAGQLGRYLLSGAKEEDIEEIACSAASSLLGLELEPAEPDAGEARVILQKTEGPSSTFRDTDGVGELVVVAHGKVKENMLGRALWRPSMAETVGMRLTEAVGLAELIANAGGLEGARETGKELAAAEFLAEARFKRERFRAWESARMVMRGAPDGWRDRDHKPFATVYSSDGGRRFLYDDWRLCVEGSEEELLAEAERRATSRASSVSGRSVLAILAHKESSKKSLLASALVASARSIWRDEGERTQNREWAEEQVREARSARVFEDKKNPDADHVTAARDGFIGRAFSRTEVDDACDLTEFLDLQDELEARFRCGEIPQIDTSAHDLRFRLLGRHRAWGIYFPYTPVSSTPCIAVDCRYPASLLHEFAHAYDFENGMPSNTDVRFRLEILRPFCDEFRRMAKDGGLSISPKKVAYYTTPTEVFARSWEVYASVNGFGGSFVKKPEVYALEPAYKGLMDRKDVICAYFDGFARPREKARLLTPLERAEELLNDEGRDSTGELRRMVAAGSVDTAELSAYSPAAARRLDELAEYEAALSMSTTPDPGAGEQMSIFDCMEER